MKKILMIVLIAVMASACGMELKPKEEAPQIVYLIGGGTFKATNVKETENRISFTDETGRKITWKGEYLLTDTPFPPAPEQPAQPANPQE